MMTKRLKFEVGGQHFAISESAIKDGPSSRLKTFCNDGVAGRVIIDRPSDSFAAILGMYQTGELHIPVTSCPGAFLTELQFWEISSKQISLCCLNRLEGYLDEQDTLQRFKESLKHSSDADTYPMKTKSRVLKIRKKIWEVVNYGRPSIPAKIYFALAFLMVLLSIFVLAYSTDQSFRRKMTNCERLEYMTSHNMEGRDLIADFLKQYCHDQQIRGLGPVTNSSDRTNWTASAGDVDDRGDFMDVLFTFFFEKESQFEFESPLVVMSPPRSVPRAFNESEIAFNESEITDISENIFQEDLNETSLLDNITAAFTEMPPLFSTETGFEGTDKLNYEKTAFMKNLSVEKKRFTIPNIKLKARVLVVLEIVGTVFFTVDILLRLCSCPRISHYFFSFVNLADAIAIICAYMLYFIQLCYRREHFTKNWTDYLVYAQLLRSLRLFRVISNVRAGRVLAYSARKNLKDLSILILFLIAGMCVFSSIFFIVESKDNVESIPVGWYWAVVTMTTVGYGDIYPETGIGRLVACCCSVAGIVLLALTVPIFTNQFIILYQHVGSQNKVAKYLDGKKQTKETCFENIATDTSSKTV